jgi:hypothetical protein
MEYSPLSGATVMPPKAAAAIADRRGSYGPILLKKAKMNRSKFLPLRPSKTGFLNPTYHSELTKAAGRK